MPDSRKISVFVLCPAEDEPLRARLEKFLYPLVYNGIIEILPGSIPLGRDVDEAVKQNLLAAEIVPVLITVNWPGMAAQLTLLRERRAAGVRVIPVLAGPAEFDLTPFGNYQPVPRDRRPITTRPDQDAGWLEVAQGVREVVNSLRNAPAHSAPSSAAPGAGGADAGSAAVRVLFLASSPTDALTLKLSSEFTEIDKSLRAAASNRVQLVYPGRVPAPALAETLLRYDPTVLHFSGHGQPTGALVFEDQAGASSAAPPEVIADLFRILKGRLVCVVLSACYSRTQADALRPHIDCVVGMAQAIQDDDAIRFASAFYLALGHGKSVRTAFELGCNQIRLGGVIEAGGRRDALPVDATRPADPSGERVPVLLCRDGVDPDRVTIL